jgi:exodeoxyribonuclease-3
MMVFLASDHKIATPGIGNWADATSAYRDERFSGHAPLIVDYDGD